MITLGTCKMFIWKVISPLIMAEGASLNVSSERREEKHIRKASYLPSSPYLEGYGYER